MTDSTESTHCMYFTVLYLDGLVQVLGKGGLAGWCAYSGCSMPHCMCRVQVSRQ